MAFLESCCICFNPKGVCVCVYDSTDRFRGHLLSITVRPSSDRLNSWTPAWVVVVWSWQVHLLLQPICVLLTFYSVTSCTCLQLYVECSNADIIKRLWFKLQKKKKSEKTVIKCWICSSSYEHKLTAYISYILFTLSANTLSHLETSSLLSY